MAALLLLAAGFLTQISIFAQENESLTGLIGEAADREISPETENPLRAAEEIFIFSENTEDLTPSASSSIWAAFRMILVLSLVAVAIYGVVFFIKKTSKPAAANDPFLKILATSHLGSNRYAHIVSVGSKAWLLGSSDGGVNLIGEIDDTDVINEMLLEDSRKSSQSVQGRFPDFRSMLRRLGTPAEKQISAADEIRRRRERLRGL